MAHVMILGMTLSGKSTLAKRLMQGYKDAGIKTILLDPLNDPEFPADFRTTDPDKFLSVLWASRGCAAFIDEAGDAVGRYDIAMQQTATKSRHWGHRMHYMTQGGTQLAPIVRNQCSHLYLFTTAKSDCKIHADEWNQPALIEGSQLAQGEFFHVTRYGDLERQRLF